MAERRSSGAHFESFKWKLCGLVLIHNDRSVLFRLEYDDDHSDKDKR